MSSRYDEQRALELLQGDDTRRQGFAMVVEHYSSQLYWQIRRLVLSHDDANDILQDTFLNAWNNICYFRQEARLTTWLYRIAMNQCLTFLKSRQNRMERLDGQEAERMISCLTQDGGYTGGEIETAFQKALLGLPPKQRMVFNMRYFQEMTYDDMSQVLGTTVGALKADYHHAVRKIRNDLEAQI